MRKQKESLKKAFVVLALFFLWLSNGDFVFEKRISLAADSCASNVLLCQDPNLACPEDKPFPVESETCQNMGLVCCAERDDEIIIKKTPTATPTTTPSSGGTNCKKSPSEGTENGFLLFKGSIVTCGRSCNDENTTWDESDSCNLCHFVLMAKKIYDLLFSVVVFAAILMITIGGTIYLVSAGNRSLAGTGREMITKTLAGFVLFLLGELIVITVLNFAGANLGMTNEKGKWYDFTCDTTNVPELSVEEL